MPSTATASSQEPTAAPSQGIRPPRSQPSSRNRRPQQPPQPKANDAAKEGGNSKIMAPVGAATRQPLRSMASLEVVAREAKAKPKQGKEATAAAGAGPEPQVKKRRSHGKNLGRKSSKVALGAGSGTQAKRAVISSEARPSVQSVPEPKPTSASTLNPSAPAFSFVPSLGASLPAPTLAFNPPKGPRAMGNRIVSDPIRNGHPLPPKPVAALPSKPTFLPERPPVDVALPAVAAPATAAEDSRFASLTAAVPSSSLHALLPTRLPLGVGYPPMSMLIPDSPPSQVLSSSLPPLSASVLSFASATAAVEDLTPRTQRRVAGQGLKKAMSEAASRRRRGDSASSIPLPTVTSHSSLGLGRRPASMMFGAIAGPQPRSVSDSSSASSSASHRTPSSSSIPRFAGAHRRSTSIDSTLKKLPLRGPRPLENVDEKSEEGEISTEVEEPIGSAEGEKENDPPTPMSPDTPSPRPSIVSLPPPLPTPLRLELELDEGDEDDGPLIAYEDPPSPPSPAALLLSASFMSWPAESIRSATNTAQKAVVFAEPEEVGVAEEAEAKEETQRSYVPKPLLLPSKLARTATASSTSSSTSGSTVVRSPKSSGPTRPTSHVRAATLAGVSLSFSALAEQTQTEPERTGFQGRRESFVGITGSPTRKRFGPAAGTRPASVHSRRDWESVNSFSPPASPTVPLSPRQGATRRTRPNSIYGSPPIDASPHLHSRSISVGSGWRRERPASIVGASGLGLGLMRSIEEAVAKQEQEHIAREESGNGEATVSSGSEAVVDATAPGSTGLLPAVELAEAFTPLPLELRGTRPDGKGKEKKSTKYGHVSRKGQLRPPPVPVPVEEGYCSLQDLLEQAGALHTRVVSPDRPDLAGVRQDVGTPSPSPPTSPKAKVVAGVSQALRARTSLLGLLSAVKDVLLPPASPAAMAMDDLPASPPGHRHSASDSTMSSVGAQLNIKSPELEAAEQAVRGRIAGWVQYTEECLLDDLRPTVLLPGQTMVVGKSAQASPLAPPFSPDKNEADSRPFRIGSPPPLSVPMRKPARRHIADGLEAPKAVRRAKSDLLLRKPSMPVLSSPVVAAPAIATVNQQVALGFRSRGEDDFILIHDLDGPGAATFEHVSATEVYDFYDHPPMAPGLLIAASTCSPPSASPAVQALRRQGSAEGLARAKLGKLLELDEERMVKRKKSLGALAYGPPPRIIVTEI